MPPTLNWKNYEFPQDGYSIDLPTEPKHQTEASLEMSIVTADVGQAGSYNVAVSHVSEASLPGYDPVPALDSGQERAVRSSQGTLLSQKAIELDGHPGREFSFTGIRDGNRFTAYSRIYAVGEYFYNLLHVAPAGRELAAERTRFYDSFRLRARRPAP